MRHLDLFSGIGGFSLAAQRVWGDELEIVGFCEIDKYCQKVLQKNFPGVPIHDDVKVLNGNEYEKIDLITGGFPCQDISVAGKGAGIKAERSGLWAEMFRLIKEVQPRWAIIENVPNLRSKGLTLVLQNLSEIGYMCEWHCIPACAVGAPHQRDRIWIVAYPFSECDKPCIQEALFSEINAANSQTETTSQCDEEGESVPQGWWAVEPDVGRVVEGVAKRVDRIKGLGNSIVPQVAQVLMEGIKLCQNQTQLSK